MFVFCVLFMFCAFIILAYKTVNLASPGLPVSALAKLVLPWYGFLQCCDTVGLATRRRLACKKPASVIPQRFCRGSGLAQSHSGKQLNKKMKVHVVVNSTSLLPCYALH